MEERPSPKGQRWLVVAFVGVALITVGAVLWALGQRPTAPVDEVTSPDAPAESAEGASADADIESESDQVAETLRAKDDWSVEVVEVRRVTVLRRPVIQVVTAVEGENASAAESLSADLEEAVRGLASPHGWSPTFCIHVLSADGELLAVKMHTDERWRLESPPAPVDAASLQSWLEAVYADEEWYPHVTAVLGPEGDPNGYLTIVTDLDPTDTPAAQQIAWAVNSSGATFAPAVRVTFGASEAEWTSLMDGRDVFAP